jgi:hypothetical protein
MPCQPFATGYVGAHEQLEGGGAIGAPASRPSDLLEIVHAEADTFEAGLKHEVGAPATSARHPKRAYAD